MCVANLAKMLISTITSTKINNSCNVGITFLQDKIDTLNKISQIA